MAVLSAPAGYAKTTTLHAWEAEYARPFVWVSCDRRHSDPSFFAGALARALDEVTPVGQETIAALGVEASWPDMALERLGRAIEGSDSTFALVIDDAHRLGENGSAELLAGLIEVLPTGARLVVSSRTAPPFPLGRLRANGELVELGPSDLAMTRGESAKLLGEAGLSVGPEELNLIHERTEGWPAALHLATLALAGREDGTAAVADFAGDDRAVTEYLQDEFLASSSPDEIDFMTRSSILEVLDGPICDAVLERSDSAQMLRELSRSNALIVPLDRSGTSYRYHHLFAGMLRSELRATRPDLIQGLHARAARFHADSSETELAVEHAIASGDVCLAGSMMWESLPEMTGSGRTATLLRWLGAIGEDRFTECHGLLFTAAHASLMIGAGEEAAHWLSVASDLPARPGCPVEVDSALSILRAIIAPDGTSRMLASAREAVDLFEPGDVWRGAAAFYLGAALDLLGDPGSAEPVLREAARSTAQLSPVMQALSLAQLAQIAYRQGDHDRAMKTAREAGMRMDNCGLSGVQSLVLVHATEAMMLAAGGRPGPAAGRLETGAALFRSLSGFAPWYHAEVGLALAETGLRLGDRKMAIAMARPVREWLASAGDAVTLHDWLSDLEERLEAAQGRSPGEAGLTRAELRTLQFLPTHFSFRQIGERNHVSANTVKTQARAIYTKLGVSSRAEAVERATTLGLLSGKGPDDRRG